MTRSSTLPPEIRVLEREAPVALFKGEVRALAAALYQNERPLRGLAGQLDWHFRGWVSRAIRAGAMSGEPGECVYVPMNRHGRVLHLLFVGGGHSDRPGSRPPLPEVSLAALRRNLRSLKLESVGVSRADLGGASDHDLKGLFSQAGGAGWILP